MSHPISIFSKLVLLMFVSVRPSETAQHEYETQILDPLVRSENYIIHVLSGCIGEGFWESVIYPGLVVLHTDLDSGEMRWLLRTGTFALPTCRISYHTIRILGIHQTDEFLVVLLYRSSRYFTTDDRSLREPPEGMGNYYLEVFRKSDGECVQSIEIPDGDHLPLHVPRETAEIGLIELKNDGCIVFGLEYLLSEDGITGPVD